LLQLVYFERHEDIVEAITQEKVLKRWRRAWKVKLIESANPEWRDLYAGILGGLAFAGATRGEMPAFAGMTNGRASGPRCQVMPAKECVMPAKAASPR
jgi:hypothetical protein